MNSPDWYFAQADLLRGRADACLQLARRLDGAALFDLTVVLRRADLAVARWRPSSIVSSSSTCRGCRTPSISCASNALGLSGDADDLERQGAYLLVLQREHPDVPFWAASDSLARFRTPTSSQRPNKRCGR